MPSVPFGRPPLVHVRGPPAPPRSRHDTQKELKDKNVYHVKAHAHHYQTRDTMNLLSLLKKTQPADVAALISANAIEIEAERTKLPALRTALDEAALVGKGGAEALAAVRSVEAAIELLEHRGNALARAKGEAEALSERQRVDALVKAAGDAVAEHESVRAEWDTSARATAAVARKLDAAVERVRDTTAAVVQAGGEAPPCPLADHVAARVHLPNSDYDKPAHHEQAARLNPTVVALHQKVHDTREAGEAKLREFAAGVRSVVASAIR